jgi:hypothetical protein
MTSRDPARPLAPAAIAGVWRLVAWHLVAPDGTTVDAFGPHPKGLLTYTSDGFMSVVISRAGRPTLPDDPAARSSDEKAAAFDGAHAYAGSYTLGHGEIIHHVRVSTIPNYEGVDQHRRLVLDGDTLVLSTPPGQAAHLTPGSQVYGRLTWRRISAASED